MPDATLNNLYEGLLSVGYEGSLNDVIYKYLGDRGCTGSLNDRLKQLLEAQGYTGSLSDNLKDLVGSVVVEDTVRYLSTFDETAETYIQLGSDQNLNFINGFEIHIDAEYTETVTAGARYIGDSGVFTIVRAYSHDDVGNPGKLRIVLNNNFFDYDNVYTAADYDKIHSLRLVGTFDGDTGTSYLEVFKNGVSQGTVQKGFNIGFSINQIGAGQDVHYSNGVIKDVKMWYGGSLVLDMPINEADLSGSATVKDYSASYNDGTAYNFVSGDTDLYVLSADNSEWVSQSTAVQVA